MSVNPASKASGPRRGAAAEKSDRIAVKIFAGAACSLVLVFVFVVSLSGCRYFNSYAEIENASSRDLSGVRLRLTTQPPIVLPVAAVRAGERTRVRLPRGFGETTLLFEAQMGTTPVSATCGYLEAGGMYLAKVRVLADGSADCVVEI